MREHPSQKLRAVLERLAEKSSGWVSDLRKKVASGLGSIASALIVATNPARTASAPVSSAVAALIETLSDKEKTVRAFKWLERQCDLHSRGWGKPSSTSGERC